MPRLKPIEDTDQDSGSRRSSGRARRPTAKIEALAGTKFYPADSAKANSNASTSLSPGHSADSSFNTPISPQSELAPYGTQDNTSPSTISVHVGSPILEHANKQAMGTPMSDNQASTESTKHDLRRERKPTRRALEMSETASQTRRRRRTKAEMAALRASATPSDISSTPEVQSPTTERLSVLSQQSKAVSDSDFAQAVPSRSRSPSRGRRGAKKIEQSEESPDIGPTKKNNPSTSATRGKLSDSRKAATADAVDSTPPAAKNSRQSVKRAVPDQDFNATNSNHLPSGPAIIQSREQPPQSEGVSGQLDRSVRRAGSSISEESDQPALPASRRKSQQRNKSLSPIHEPERGTLRLKLTTRRSTRLPTQVEAETPKRRARSSAVNYAEPDLSAQDTSSDEITSNAPTTPKRSARMKRGREEDLKAPQDNVGVPAPSSGTRRLRLRQPVQLTEDLDMAANQDVNSTEKSTSSRDSPRRQSRRDTPAVEPAVAAPSLKRRASSPEEERPRKSLKLKLSVPGLKAPSKLRFSINSQDINESPPRKASAGPPAKSSAEAPEKSRPQMKINISKAPSTAALPASQPQPTGPAPKLSRRAQAKADAKAFGRVRQATESANHDRLYDTTYGGASSHYAPSMGLVRPAVDCGLFCLPEPSRILAFAKIAAESIESDDEENSDGGRQPELLNKWLQKGSEHCVCNKPSHGHGDVTSDASRSQSAGEHTSTISGRTDGPQNEDVAAAMPDTTDLPLDIPPVNSVMSKAQGRRVSAFYNVLTGSPSPHASRHGSPTVDSRPQSMSASSRKTPGSPAQGVSSTPASISAIATSTAKPRTGSYDERMRWDYQALERVRVEAKEAGLVISIDMSYAQVKSLLEQHKMQHSAAVSEKSSTHISRQPSFQPPNGSLAIAEEGFEADASPGTHGFAATYADVEDDTEDRLLQIIGESFKAAMRRNKSASAESHTSSDDRRRSLSARSRR